MSPTACAVKKAQCTFHVKHFLAHPFAMFHVSQATRRFHVNQGIAARCGIGNVSRESFSYAELREDNVQHVLDIDRPDDAAKSISSQAQFLGPQLLFR